METNNTKQLTKYLSPFSVWALALGCSVGWGAFVMPSSTFLPTSGPLGIIIGMIIGAALMFVIGASYHYLMNKYETPGGSFIYTKKILGIDHGFLCAWFLSLTYIAIIWANATALAIISRYILGDALQFGFHYEIAGYQVYFGETIVCLSAIIICSLLCILSKKASVVVQSVLASILVIGITICFISVLIKNDGALNNMRPLFKNDKNSVLQIISIIVLAPWAFVGFESISNSSCEFKFPLKKSLLIMGISLIVGAFCYIMLVQIGISFIPQEFTTWQDFIKGTSGLPTFIASKNALGSAGVAILGISALAGILTGIIGNTIATSRLFYSMAEEKILPNIFGKLDKNGVPRNAIIFIMIISIIMPFFGRTAIGWIVDVTTIGAIIVYAYTSYCGFKTARRENNKIQKTIGLGGIAISIVIGLYFLFPSLVADSRLSTESFLILIIWSILGIIFYRFLFKRDTERRFGKSIIVWISMVFMLFFISQIWVRETANTITERTENSIEEYYYGELSEDGIEVNDDIRNKIDKFITKELKIFNDEIYVVSIVQMTLILIALVIMINIFYIMQRREREVEAAKLLAEQKSEAKTTFLSNMSHDLRTPLNAITGYTALAKEEQGNSSKTYDYLNKIESSSRHLLSLINDILDIRRIESGLMELDNHEENIVSIIEEAFDFFKVQMDNKHITYNLKKIDITDPWVMCDRNRLNRVLVNLISNAYKYTLDGGEVNVTLSQISHHHKVNYLISVKDNGIGMSEEFAEKVFDSFEREKDDVVSGIQGTGLGMAITKSFVDLMGGKISVDTAKGKGTEFIIEVAFEKANHVEKNEDNIDNNIDFSNYKILVVDDNELNIEIATLLLENVGFTVVTAQNGKEAYEKYRDSEDGEFDVILMDINMPIMNGYEATKLIRELDSPKKDIPIVALTANALKEDIDKAIDAGMTDTLTKPIDVEKMTKLLGKILIK